MARRSYLKGDLRRAWRNHRVSGGTVMLAIAIVAALVWTLSAIG